MLFVADLVGDLEDPSIAAMNHLSSSKAAWYSIYDQGQIRKVVLLNTEEFRSGNGTRPSQAFNLGEIVGKELKFTRLTGAESAATEGVTWAGQSAHNESGDLVGEMLVEEVK